MVSYVDAMVDVTVVCVLLFVLCVRDTAMLVWKWMRCGEYRACGWYTCFRFFK